MCHVCVYIYSGRRDACDNHPSIPPSSAAFHFCKQAHLFACVHVCMCTCVRDVTRGVRVLLLPVRRVWRSAEHTSELQSLMRSSCAVFCLKNTSTTTAPAGYSMNCVDVHQTLR